LRYNTSRVNFFSHDVILPDGAHPLARVASALPDLWSRLPRRPVPFRLLPALRADGSEEARAVADGIESHLKADSVFHAHPEFVARMDRVEAEIAPLWPGLEHGEAAAHILVEMILDRWLMLRDPARLAGYYACFTREAIAAASHFGASSDEARAALTGVLSFFAESRFLEDYRTPAGLALRFSRAWSRTKLAGDHPPPEAALTEWVERAFAALAPRSEVLVDVARDAVAPLFVTAP
jgi:hypothetical protein